AGGATTDVATVSPGAVSTVASGLQAPAGLAFDTAGNLYVANYDGGTVSKVAPGGAISTFASGFTHPEGLAVDAAGSLSVSQGDNAGTISKVSPGGVVIEFANSLSGLYYPKGLAFDGAGNLYAADQPSGYVNEFAPGGAGSIFAADLNAFNPFGAPVTYTVG